jgi:hypothetical protein
MSLPSREQAAKAVGASDMVTGNPTLLHIAAAYRDGKLVEVMETDNDEKGQGNDGN